MKKRISGSLWLYGLGVMLVTGAGHPRTLGAEISQPSDLNYEEPKYLTARIYAAGSHQTKLLFEFKRVATRSGSTLKVQRDFTYPDGKPAARERVVYEGDNLVLYELEERQIGAAGTARVRHSPKNPVKGSIEFEYAREAGGKPKVRTESLAEPTLINDMVGPFLVSHWDALMRGEKLKCRYIVVPRLETVGFTFFKDAESIVQGRKLVRVRMEASSPFVAALVDPLYFTIEQAPPHRVLQYVGRTTPRLSVGSKWKDLDAVTVFDWETAR